MFFYGYCYKVMFSETLYASPAPVQSKNRKVFGVIIYWVFAWLATTVSMIRFAENLVVYGKKIDKSSTKLFFQS